MTVQLFNPENVMHDVPFRHVAVATGSRQVHIAGQTSNDAAGQLVAPGDLTGQTSQALRNVAAGLAAAGATFADVVRFTFYLPDWQTFKHDAFLAGVAAVADELGIPQPMPPSTLIGVAGLFDPGNLIEIEATAVID